MRIQKYKTGRASTVGFNLHQIKRRALFLGHPVFIFNDIFCKKKTAFRPLMLGILSKSDAKFNISCQNYAIHKGVSYDADIENKYCTIFFFI